jgi:hypothetical protein
MNSSGFIHFCTQVQSANSMVYDLAVSLTARPTGPTIPFSCLNLGIILAKVRIEYWSLEMNECLPGGHWNDTRPGMVITRKNI